MYASSDTTNPLRKRVPLLLLLNASYWITYSRGKGLWRAHPRLASNPHFVKHLNRILSKNVHQFHMPCPPPKNGNRSRHALQHFIYSTKKRAGITKKLSLDPSLLPVLSPQLTVVEQQLTFLQQYHVDDLALRSGIRWREMGELSAVYLKRTISARQSRQTIPPLLHPSSLSLCSSKDEMLDAAATFYSDLYSPDPIDPAAIDSLLADLPDSLHLSPSASSFMISPLTLDTLLDAFSRSPKKSSPGIDGLPYVIVRLIVIHPSCSQIAVEVFNNALCFADIPPSWLRSCVTLLPKKPPFDTLKNWRPISLINTDAKVFTRILSSRMIITASKLINPYQTGFVRGRFIAGNGLLMKLVMEQARISSSSGIGLLLDQEKAYDRVHPDYLRAVLLRFGYPLTVVDCIGCLFFSTDLQINVNGFLSQCIPQRRGLKQGDPISPILFNLAFEPLLRKIQLDSRIMWYRLPSPVPNPSVYPVKLLAYADDIIYLLNDPSELTHLQAHLSLYSRASNAKVNFHKTEAVSLSGASSIYNSHDCQSPAPVVYLGFPLNTSTSQRNLFLDGNLDKVSKACQIHQQRGLFVPGRTAVLNSLVLSKLWHVLRVVSVPMSFFKCMQSVISKFINFRIFPKISFSTACSSRSGGGLGVLDPVLQQSALQLRWLQPLMSSPTDIFVSVTPHVKSFVLPRLIAFLYSQVSTSVSGNHFPTAPHDLDHRFSFLFPTRRPPATKNINGSLYLLFQAIDRLPKSYTDVVISAATCLELPMASIIIDSQLSALRRSMASLPSSVSDTLDSANENCLRPKRSTEFTIYPSLSRQILRLVTNDELALLP
ncbi:hypothetical protein INT47_003842, partial [Mucor saturninus]